MIAPQESRELFIDETERKPNRYAASVLAGVVAVIAVVCVFNELGIFALNDALVRLSLAAALMQFLVVFLIVRKPARRENPASKFIIMGMVLFLVLTLTILLNIHAVLAFVLPLLLATQYRSGGISRMALIGSVICCGIAPILSYFLNTWSLLFMTGYVQTFCHVTVSTVPGNSIGTLNALGQILLYWSLPQMLTLCAFGIILFSATRSSIQGVRSQLKLVNLKNDLSRQEASISSMQEKLLYSMSDIIESRDLETGDHVRRTSEVVRLLVDAMCADPKRNIAKEFRNHVIKAAPMHDLGKIAVPDAILKKPGRLSAEEYEIVKQHPIKSAQIIMQTLTGIESDALLRIARNMALYHHERMDGTGYPEGLAGEQIPLEARIMAIADIYDALVSERCYKAPMSFEAAFDTIESAMGTQLDPALNRYFVDQRREIENFYRS